MYGTVQSGLPGLYREIVEKALSIIRKYFLIRTEYTKIERIDNAYLCAYNIFKHAH